MRGISRFAAAALSKRGFSIAAIIFVFAMSDTVTGQSQVGPDVAGRAGDGISVASLSSDGSRLAIGSPRSGENGTNSGEVRIFEYSGHDWEPLGGNLVGASADSSFGNAVSLSHNGMRVAVGSRRSDVNGEDSGRAQVFEWSGAEWVQLGSSMDGDGAGDEFGSSVALSGDGEHLAVGAIWADSTGLMTGEVRVFEWSGGDWVAIGPILAGVEDAEMFRKVSISYDGARLAVGAPGSDANGSDSGRVLVYEWNGTEWIQLGSDIIGENAVDQAAQISLSPDGQTLAIGANLNDGNGESAGHVRVFRWNGSEWVQLGMDIDGDSARDVFGVSTSLSQDGNRLAVGASGSNDSAGYARVYEWSGETWQKLGDDVRGDAPKDFCGSQVALTPDGNRVAVVNSKSDLYGEDSGHVEVYDYSEFNAFTINAGLNDAWFNLETGGQGFLISVLPDAETVFLAWFTYDTEIPPEDAIAHLGDPGHRWLTAQGTYAGKDAVLDIVLTSNGIFDEATDVVRTDPPGSDGTIILAFDDCYTGTIEYNIPSISRQGVIPIQRIVNDNVAVCEALNEVSIELPQPNPESPLKFGEGNNLNAGLNDAWFNLDTPGQGILLSVLPVSDVVFLAWFTYDTELPPADAIANLGDSGHRWLTAQGLYEGGRAVLDLVVTSGGLFDFPTEVERTDPPGSDGTITLDFADCYSGTITYDITAINQQRSFTVQRIVNDNVPLCEALMEHQ
jgi:hypothetical protein